MTSQARERIGDVMRECIGNCLNCFQMCERTIQHCLSLGGQHAAPVHIRTLQDCAQICATSAAFMLRMSPLHSQVCGVCAEACQACAESCRGMGRDSQMLACAEACQACAESCRRMATGV